MELDWLHVVDSSFPTGAFAHSFGLETLAPASVGELESILSIRVVEALGRFELVFLRHAYVLPLADLDELFNAMLLPREARAASSAIGLSLLRSACDLVDSKILTALLDHGRYRHQPIAFGAIGAALQIRPDAAAETYAFQSVRASVSVMQRLGRLGQRDAQRVLHRLKPAVRAAVEHSSSLRIEEAGAFMPVWDIASMQHERATVRMFAS